MPQAYSEQGLLKKNPLLGSVYANANTLQHQKFMSLYGRAVGAGSGTRNEFATTVTADYDEYKDRVNTSIASSRQALVGLNLFIHRLAKRAGQKKLRKLAGRDILFAQDQVDIWQKASARRQDQIDQLRQREEQVRAQVVKSAPAIKKMAKKKKARFVSANYKAAEEQRIYREKVSLVKKASDYNRFFGANTFTGYSDIE